MLNGHISKVAAVHFDPFPWAGSLLCRKYSSQEQENKKKATNEGEVEEKKKSK